ncbi:MAG: hypothetical protein KGL39_38505 [Patescibacteria group bacterium]|nr:hypothetical protein [Patescibacteria group bacterium]
MKARIFKSAICSYAGRDSWALQLRDDIHIFPTWMAAIDAFDNLRRAFARFGGTF